MAIRREIIKYSIIVLIVAAVQPVLSAKEPQNQDQQGTGVSQARTRSMVASDPCASFRELLSAVPMARPEETSKDVDESRAPQPSQTGVKVSVSPQIDTRLAVGYSLRLAATVTGATNTDVEWAVAGPGCSGLACGSVEGDVYFAPTSVPNPPTVRLTATSKADSRASNSTMVCLVQPGGPWRRVSAAEAINAAPRKTALNNSAAAGSDVQIVTDTQGVDFGPYLRRVVHDIKQNWYSLIPKVARPPVLKQGTVSIEFAIMKNGQIAGLHYISSSGDVALDRAVCGGITASNPLPPLPEQFAGQNLGLRMNFRYNPGNNPSKNQRLTRILPMLVNVRTGSSLQFTPVLNGVTGATKFPITWSVVGDCAAAACGTISQTGMYTAPPTVPKAPTIWVEAKADGVDETASAIVTILPPESSQNDGP